MSAEVCKTCRTAKAPFQCGICQCSICKKCTQFLDETFQFRRQVPESLKHSSYCMNCFDDEVSAPLADYQDKLERAKEIIIFTKDRSKITRLLKRKADPYQVDECEDQEEALMKMSFLAVEDNYNCLIDVALKSRKIINGSHRKAIWSGEAVPINIDPNKLRDD
jgi:hypothetical protein